MLIFQRILSDVGLIIRFYLIYILFFILNCFNFSGKSDLRILSFCGVKFLDK